jgi:AcrR family transcriptional regulator
MKTKVAPTLHDPKKLDSILDAAIGIFAEQGYRTTDVQVIADMAEVGKGTVYRYFGNKEALFQAVVDTGMQRLERHVNRVVRDESAPDDHVRAVGMAYADFFQKNPQLVEILIMERAEFRGSIPDTHLFYRQKNRGAFEDILRRGIRAGTFRKVNVREATNTYANMLYGTVVCGVLAGDSRSIRGTAKHAIEIFLQGIRA